jgi:predicted transcriptional regulator
MQEKQKVTLYLPPDLHRQLKIRAAVDAETMTDIAQRAIGFYLEHPEVVEQVESYGHTHRVYSCPECSTSVVLRQGVMTSLQEKSGVLVEDTLSVETVKQAGIAASANSQGEGELVPC